MKYPTQSCVIKWLKEKLIFELIFWIIVLSCCSELLLEIVFWVSVKKTGEVQVLPQNKSYILSIKDYSMMVATRPEPTVLPPSRYLNSVFQHIFYAFYGWNLHSFVDFTWSIFICMVSWHRFGTGILAPDQLICILSLISVISQSVSYFLIPLRRSCSIVSLLQSTYVTDSGWYCYNIVCSEFSSINSFQW